MTGTPVAPFILVSPGVQVKPVERDPLLANRNLNDIRPDFGIESVAIHAKIERHRVVMFGRQAEIAKYYLIKGAQVYVEGRNTTRKWRHHDGADRYTTVVVCNDFVMLGKRGEASNETSSTDGEEACEREAEVGPGLVDDWEESIPF